MPGPASGKPAKPFPVRLLPDRRREGQQLAQRLRDALQRDGHHDALASLPAALAGDAAAARNLVATVPAGQRGFVALALHLHDVPADVMRETMEAVAFAEPAALHAAVPSPDRIAAMCRHAETEAPPDLPDTFPIWRGVRGMGIRRGSKGLLWTLDRAAACRFATSGGTAEAYPMVLAATARRQDIGMQVGDDLLLYRVQGAHADPQPGGAEGWRRAAAGPAKRDAAPCTVENHVQAIGAVLAAEPAADAIGTLFNTYSELPSEGERAAFALALVTEAVMARAGLAAP